MQRQTLAAVKRTILGKKVRKLRKEGLIPVSIFGKGFKSESAEVKIKDFQNVYGIAGETGLVDVKLGTDVLPILIHNVQYHPINQQILHADFFKVNLKEKVTTKVPLELTGDAPAISAKTGVLLSILAEIEVEALPSDLPDKISVSLANLINVGDTIKISDLQVSDKIKITSNLDSEIVKVAPLVSKEAEQMAKEEEAAAAAAAASAAKETPETAEIKTEETAPVAASPEKKEDTKPEAAKS